MNRKRQIINHMLAELHEMHEQMIEEALAYSDCLEAKIVIQYIMEKSWKPNVK